MTVSITTAILAGVAAALAGVVAVWIHGMIVDAVARRTSRHASIYRCDACGHVYEDSRRVPLSGCDRCGALNEAVRQ